jgi:hypothetical protein
VGGVDEAWHAFFGGNVLLVEKCLELLILVWVGRCCASAQGRAADKHHDAGDQSANVASSAGEHERFPFLPVPSADGL